jgi:hypothetical protein
VALPQWDAATTLVTVFGAAKHDALVKGLEDVRNAFPNSMLIGCSTAGEIHGECVLDGSLSVGLVRLPRTRMARAIAPVRDPADSFRAGDTIARQLEGPDLRAVFVLCDGLKVNGSELIRGMNSVLPKGVVITGGLAGDGSDFKFTWVLHNGVPESGIVAAVAFYGPHVRVGHGSRGGWDAFGVERVVTRSSGNVVFELDGSPALPLYEKYLGDRAAGLPGTGLLFPLTIMGDGEHRLVRTLLAIDRDKQSLTFAGDVPQGSRVQLMRANIERVVEAAGDSASDAASSTGTGACLCVAVSCVGRRLVLGERTEEELESALDALPAGSVQVGFYSYGELSPVATGRCDLQNQTMTVTTIREE